MAAGIKIADAYFVLGMEWGKDSKRLPIDLKQLDFMDQLGSTLISTGAALTAASVAIGSALAYATNAAGKHMSEMTRIDMIYGDLSSSQKAWMDDYMQVTNRGTAATTRMLTTFGAFTKGLGFTDETAAGLSKQLTVLTGDFQTFTGISTEEGMQRMISALSGSGEVLDRFGINIKEAALNQKMLAMGMPSISQGATEQMKTLARLALITEALKNQGAESFDQYADTYPKALAITKMAIEDLTVEVGNALLPTVREMMKMGYRFVRMLGTFIKENQWAVQVVAVFAAALGAIGSTMLALGGTVWAVVGAYQTYLKLAYAVEKINAITWPSMLKSMSPILVALLAIAAAFALVAMGSDSAGKSIRENLGTIKLAWEADDTEALVNALFDVAGVFAVKLLSVLIRAAAMWMQYINLSFLQIIPALVGFWIEALGKGLIGIIMQAAKMWNAIAPKMMQVDMEALGRWEDFASKTSGLVNDAQKKFFDDARDVIDSGADYVEELAGSIAETAEADAKRRRMRLEETDAAKEILADRDKVNEDAQAEAMAGLQGKETKGTAGSPLSAADFRSVSGQQAAQQNMMSTIVDYLSRIAENTAQGAQAGQKTTNAVTNLQLEAV